MGSASSTFLQSSTIPRVYGLPVLVGGSGLIMSQFYVERGTGVSNNGVCIQHEVLCAGLDAW